jgi:glycolate oxidase iron-sulfur subunit
VSGEESASPRGRIAAMRDVHWEGADADDAFVGFMEACVQCRGCETACPSGVPFGRLMERTRHTLADSHRMTPRWQRLAYRMLPRHRLLVAGSRALAVLQRLHLVPRSVALPRLPLHDAPLRASGDDVWMFTGCVMDAWMRDTHRVVQRVIEATGAGVALPDGRAACCGALHVHAGLVDDATALAQRVMSAFPGDAPIVVDSAGCGAALKDYGHLLGTTDAVRFSGRVVDVHEWLVPHLDRLPAPVQHLGRVVVQDPCHLRHVQRAHLPVRAVLAPYATIIELDDEGLCCGAGGAYSTLHPDTARAVRERKLESIARSGGALVASANPGCAIHLRAAGVDVRHPIELVADATGLR